jgi:3-oxoacyl-[acyl-carrier protein] reductase
MSESRPGPVVLITGAAGGLGRGLVAAFAEAGWRVAAGYHVRAPEAAGERVRPVALDVTRPGDPERAVGAALEWWGRLDALIHNAGVTADALLAQQTEADWDRVVAVNLTGAMRCARAAAGALGAAGGGHIVNIGSYAGRAGGPGQAAYAAAKAGLIGLTAALAAELAGQNVRVNVVLPGVLPTPMTARLSAAAQARLVAANRLGRLNAVEEVARFVVFLCGLQNVSGQVFQLDSRPARWG